MAKAKAKAMATPLFHFSNILSLFTSYQLLFLIIQIKKVTTKQFFILFYFFIPNILTFSLFQKKKKKSYFFLTYQLILSFAMPKTFIKRTLYSFFHS
jgi:hypothetical protein